MINTKIIAEQSPNIPKFPCLMQSKDSGNIVLFVESGKGIVIALGGKQGYFYKVGDMAHNWDMEKFEFLRGKVELRNVE